MASRPLRRPMFRHARRWLAAGCVAAALAGCQPGPSQPKAAAAISGHPERIVSLNLCTDQLLLQLVEPQRIAAVSRLAHDPGLSVLEPQARALPAVRGDTEEVLLLKPDLVLVGRYTARYTTQMLRSLGIPVLEVPLASSLAEVQQQITLVADAVGESAKGRALVQALQQRQLELQQAAQQQSVPWPVAAERSWQGYSTGTGTLMNELIELAGYRNAGVEAGLTGYGYLPLERLVATHPDLMLTPDYASDMPSVVPRDQLHPALQHTALDSLTMQTRTTICGGLWSLDTAARMALQRQGR